MIFNRLAGSKTRAQLSLLVTVFLVSQSIPAAVKGEDVSNGLAGAQTLETLSLPTHRNKVI